MSWTYAGAPGTSTSAERRDAVRLTIGDTDTTDQQLTDDEIAFYLSNAGDDYLLASIASARALQAKYSRKADTTHGKMSISASQRAKAYADLVAKLEHDRLTTSGGAEFFIGGTTISGKDALAADTDAVQPSFSLGQDDYQSPQPSRPTNGP